MRNHRLLVTFSACVASAFAQDTGSVSGSVTNSLTNAPVLRAHVSIQVGQKRLGALTDGSGNFTITSVAPGTGFINVDRTGFARNIQPKSVTIQAGENTSSIELKLTPTGGITGTVFDPDGQPVQSARVEVFGPLEEVVANTDDRGHYRLGGLSPGKYKVHASIPSPGLPPEIRTDGTQDVHYPPIYYPGVASSKAATRVIVAPGQDTQGIDMRLIASPIVRISGKVLNAPAGPLAIETTYSTSPNGETSEEHEVAPDGTFVFWGLDPGKYTLKARASGGEDGLESAAVEIEVGISNIDGIELPVAEPIAISGRIQFDDDQARAKATSPNNPRPDEQTARVVLQPVTEENTISAVIGPDSSFRLEKVPPGLYRVEAGTFFGVFVKSLSWGATQVEGNRFDTQNGNSNSELIVTLSAKTAKIHGIVTDSKGPVSDGRVRLILDGDEVTEVPTDAAGKYSFDEIAPGTYSILAPDEPKEPGRFNTPHSDFSDYEDAMVKLEVHSGDDLTQDVKLAAAK